MPLSSPASKPALLWKTGDVCQCWRHHLNVPSEIERDKKWAIYKSNWGMFLMTVLFWVSRDVFIVSFELWSSCSTPTPIILSFIFSFLWSLIHICNPWWTAYKCCFVEKSVGDSWWYTAQLCECQVFEHPFIYWGSVLTLTDEMWWLLVTCPWGTATALPPPWTVSSYSTALSLRPLYSNR